MLVLITRAFNNRANIYTQEEKWELCVEEYSKSIVAYPSPINYSNRGRAYQILKDYDKAIIDLTKAIDLDKEDPELYAYRAGCYIDMEDYTNALKDLDNAM